MNDFLEASKNFAGGDSFSKLMADGLDIVGREYHVEMARELEVIPATVLRWAFGVGVPMPGMQVLAIKLLRRKVQELEAPPP